MAGCQRSAVVIKQNLAVRRVSSVYKFELIATSAYVRLRVSCDLLCEKSVRFKVVVRFARKTTKYHQNGSLAAVADLSERVHVRCSYYAQCVHDRLVCDLFWFLKFGSKGCAV